MLLYEKEMLQQFYMHLTTVSMARILERGLI